MLGSRHNGAGVRDEQKRLIEEVEEAQAKLRETIEESIRLTERSDVLIAQVKDGRGGGHWPPEQSSR